MSAAGTADPLYQQPYVDKDEWRDAPVRHHYVHGGFKGTDLRFSFYFPDKAQYQHRFFQYITPVPDNENLAQSAKGEADKIGFSIASGAYFVETNGGGSSATGGPGLPADPTISAYRANAAAAQYSRIVAAKFFGPHWPFGYAYGGSGGGFRTIGGIENTDGVWDGVVPFVIGSPMSIPNVFTVRMHALRILKDKFSQIVDAMEPGGSGDMYAGLNGEERAALLEVTKMGFPARAWFGYKTMGPHAFILLYQGMVMADPKYFADFWTVPGYLGANPTPSLVKARVQYATTIIGRVSAAEAQKLGLETGRFKGQPRGTADKAWQGTGSAGDEEPPAGFRLVGIPPEGDTVISDLIIKTGAAAGKRLPLRQIAGDVVILGPGLFGPPDPKLLAAIKPGDAVQVNNSNFLASQTYHRHQVPGPDFAVWNQFKGADGKPLYLQRPMLLGPLFAKGASGTVQTGKFKGKMIVVESLLDREAYPWQADWYRAKVQANLGGALDDHFRLWMTDNALHSDAETPEDASRTISYLGILMQALRDLSAWVEKGTPPPASTSYQVVDGQIVTPTNAAARGGIQPVVVLKADGGARADVLVGQAVNFAARVDVPPGAGKVVGADWDFEGTGTYVVAAQFKPAPAVLLTATHSFTRPGVYFAALRVAAQRQGNSKTPYALVKNLGRVRVVVK
jgi:hypothetical protein